MINWNKIFITFVFFRWWVWESMRHRHWKFLSLQSICWPWFSWIISTEHLNASRQTPNKKCLRIQAEALSTGQGEVLSAELVLRLNFFLLCDYWSFQGKLAHYRETHSNAGNVWILLPCLVEREFLCVTSLIN